MKTFLATARVDVVHAMRFEGPASAAAIIGILGDKAEVTKTSDGLVTAIRFDSDTLSYGDWFVVRGPRRYEKASAKTISYWSEPTEIDDEGRVVVRAPIPPSRTSLGHASCRTLPLEVAAMRRLMLAVRLARIALRRPDFTRAVWVAGVPVVLAERPGLHRVTQYVGYGN